VADVSKMSAPLVYNRPSETGNGNGDGNEVHDHGLLDWVRAFLK